MSQTAALYLTAHQYADEASTYGAASYYLGMRDAFEAMFRACHRVEDDADAFKTALHVIDDLDPKESNALMDAARERLKDRRAATVGSTLRAV